MRTYPGQDIGLIGVIACLKETGMGIADIKDYRSPIDRISSVRLSW